MPNRARHASVILLGGPGGPGHGCAMRTQWLAAGIWIGLFSATTLEAAVTAATAPIAQAPGAELPEVEAAIPAPVKALGVPAMVNFAGGIAMAVSTTSESAQAHVLQGLNHLHGGWEFEASRHFAAAMREDPDCLLAHWGMVMSLLNPTPETDAARHAATVRMLHLVDAGQGTELERGYAYGLIKYIQEGPGGGANAFRKVAAQFPNELQAAVFAALFSRGGYDAAGDATPDQEAAEKSLLELIARHPQSPVPLNALLVIRAEGPDLANSLELARKLCLMVPDYAPCQHLLGHYEWRSGNHRAAAAAFGRAAALDQQWMAANQATLADCPELAKAECYRIVAVLSSGDFEAALAAARKLAATPLPENRPSSPGARFLLWDAVTLPARILLQHGQRGHAKEAALTLPKPDALKKTHQHSFAYWWIDGRRFALEAERLIEEGDLAGAGDVVAALTQHGEAMQATQAGAAANGERSSWIRSFRALEVLSSEVRGHLALAGPAHKQGTAYNWFSAAADRQLPAPMCFPPLLLTPMAARLGAYYLTSQKPADAIEAYQRALAAFPNDLDALAGLQHAYEAAANPTAAAAIARQITALKAE